MKPVEQIVAVLEHAKERPGTYGLHFQKLNGVAEFLNGFNVGCQASGHAYSRQDFLTVCTKRGWERRGSLAELVSPTTGLNMKDSGMSEQKIIAELFAIEIDCWREVLGV